MKLSKTLIKEGNTIVTARWMVTQINTLVDHFIHPLMICFNREGVVVAEVNKHFLEMMEEEITIITIPPQVVVGGMVDKIIREEIGGKVVFNTIMKMMRTEIAAIMEEVIVEGLLHFIISLVIRIQIYSGLKLGSLILFIL